MIPKDRARPALRVLDPAPPLGRVLRCASDGLHARPLPRPCPSPPLALSEACCSKCLPRLGELVDQELFERQQSAPVVPVNPELRELLPY